MTCSTSETFIRDIDGAAIHDNIDNSSYGDSQVALTNASAYSFGFNMRNDSYVSEFMPGGGRYDWHRPNGEVIGRDLLVNANEPISLYSDLTASSPDMAAAIAKCKVHINYNTSNSGGAGIGNNGLVYIGTGYLERVDVAVKKVWSGDNASSRPANIKLILKQDGALYAEAVISSSEAEAGYTFKELPKYKLDDNGAELTDQPHTYTVEEDMSYVPSYQATITREADTSRTRTSDDSIAAATITVMNFTITNTYSGGIEPPITPPPPVVPPALNGEDHFAYIIGRDDGNSHPEANITRAEVATIFFRLLKDEVRDANWAETNSFSDVSAHQWYNHAISTLEAMGIVHGYLDGTFRPDESISRAEFAAIAARFDENASSTSANFSDIAGHWAEIEIAKAAANGWVNGYPDGTFKPDQAITRAEAMELVNRVLVRNPAGPEDLLENMIKWPDNMDTSKWYYLDVQEATNSHTYERTTNGTEKWLTIEQPRDWAALER